MCPEYEVYVVNKLTGKTSRIERVNAPTIEGCLDVSTRKWNTDKEWVVTVTLEGKPVATVMEEPE
jgi:hypothetical protein